MILSCRMNIDEICIDVNIVPATAAPTPVSIINRGSYMSAHE